MKDILKSSLVNIPRDVVTLYYNSGCLCPELVANEEYIIMGYENEERSRYTACPQDRMVAGFSACINALFFYLMMIIIII